MTLFFSVFVGIAREGEQDNLPEVVLSGIWHCSLEVELVGNSNEIKNK